MRKRRLLQSAADCFADNRIQYLSVIFVLILGAVIGSVSAAAMNSEKYDELSRYMESFASAFNLQPISGARIFKASLYNNIKLVLILWVSSLWIGLIPLALLQIGIKGYKMGFSTAFLIQLYRGKGLIFAAVAVMPQVVLLIPALTVYAVFGMKYAASLHRLRGQGGGRGVLKEMYLRSLVCIVGITAVTAVCALFDAFVVPPMLKPVCSFICN